ncbi:MAG: hypothetical protein P4L11_06120 [Geothrix sp.]|nr:hypothetical protein [Geothrix sp.]
MVQVSITMPEDVLDDLKRIAGLKAFSGFHALISFYIGQALRKDLEMLEAGKAGE